MRYVARHIILGKLSRTVLRGGGLAAARLHSACRLTDLQGPVIRAGPTPNTRFADETILRAAIRLPGRWQ